MNVHLTFPNASAIDFDRCVAAAALARSQIVHLPWEEVKEVDPAVRLRRRADELRLGRGDDGARAWIEWIPGARP